MEKEATKVETKAAARAWAQWKGETGKEAAKVSKEIAIRATNSGTPPATAQKERAKEAEVMEATVMETIAKNVTIVAVQVTAAETAEATGAAKVTTGQSSK